MPSLANSESMSIVYKRVASAVGASKRFMTTCLPESDHYVDDVGGQVAADDHDQHAGDIANSRPQSRNLRSKHRITLGRFGPLEEERTLLFQPGANGGEEHQRLHRLITITPADAEHDGCIERSEH